MGKKDEPRLLARGVKLSVEYDPRARRSKITAEFGLWKWLAGPWPGDYRGKEIDLWNRRREYFKGADDMLRDSLPPVKKEEQKESGH
jgi:hypothetical protein